MVDGTRRGHLLRVREALCAVTEEARTEARILCEYAFKTNSAGVFSDIPILSEEQELLDNMIAQRLTGRPLQYILGKWDFYGREFYVGEGVLIPRADTETLIEVVLDFAGKKAEKPLRVLDICSGSGCVAITLKLELNDALVWGIEKSEKAYDYAMKNREAHGARLELISADALTFDVADWDGFFDIIVSNPPYLTDEDMKNLQKEVSFEPEMALAGGEDGLYFYRALTKRYSSCLKKGGLICYEIGVGQEQEVAKIMQNNCLTPYCFSKDICGIIRVVQGVKE